jgi:hypothetical protein
MPLRRRVVNRLVFAAYEGVAVMSRTGIIILVCASLVVAAGLLWLALSAEPSAQNKACGSPASSDASPNDHSGPSQDSDWQPIRQPSDEELKGLNEAVIVDFSKMTTGDLLDLLIDACSGKDDGVAAQVEAELRRRVRDSYTDVLERLFEYADGQRELPAASICLTRISAVLASNDDPAVIESLIAHLRELWLVKNQSLETQEKVEAWLRSISPGSPASLMEKRHWVLISALYRQFSWQREKDRLICPTQFFSAIEQLAANDHQDDQDRKRQKQPDPVEFPDPWLSALYSICQDIPDLAFVLKPSAEIIIRNSYFSWPLRRELIYLYNETPRSVFELADKITSPEGTTTRSRDVVNFLFGEDRPTSDDLSVLAEALARTGVVETGDSFSGIRGSIIGASTDRLKDLMREAFAAFLLTTPGSDKGRVLVQLMYDLSVDGTHSMDEDPRGRSFIARTRGAWLPSVSAEGRATLSKHIDGYWKEHDGRPVPDGMFHVLFHVVLAEVDLDSRGSCALLAEHWSIAAQAINVQWPTCWRYMHPCRLKNYMRITSLMWLYSIFVGRSPMRLSGAASRPSMRISSKIYGSS